MYAQTFGNSLDYIWKLNIISASTVTKFLDLGVKDLQCNYCTQKNTVGILRF